MSQSGMTQGPTDLTGTDMEAGAGGATDGTRARVEDLQEEAPTGTDAEARAEAGAVGATTTPTPGWGRPPTGDPAVDDAIARLDAVADEPLDSQIEVGEQVHRVLQGRLADLGKE